MVCHEKVQGISLAVFLQAIDSFEEDFQERRFVLAVCEPMGCR